MKFKSAVFYFLFIFIAVFIINLLVRYLYMITNGENAYPDWADSFQLALVLGIFLTLVRVYEKRKRKK